MYVVFNDQVSSAGGRMILSDLSEYTAVSTDPVSSTFLGNTLFLICQHLHTSVVLISK